MPLEVDSFPAKCTAVAFFDLDQASSPEEQARGLRIWWRFEFGLLI